MGADRATDPTAGPLPGHFCLHGRVKGQDGAVQYERAQTGKKKTVSAFQNVTFSPHADKDKAASSTAEKDFIKYYRSLFWCLL